jgi:hypothetical protein
MFEEDGMQTARDYEKIIQQELMAFPRERLPELARLLRLLRKEFTPSVGKKHSATWETRLAKLKGTVSGSEAFMASKAEEKALERR